VSIARTRVRCKATVGGYTGRLVVTAAGVYADCMYTLLYATAVTVKMVYSTYEYTGDEGPYLPGTMGATSAPERLERMGADAL
jgi:hypothetical protein